MPEARTSGEPMRRDSSGRRRGKAKAQAPARKVPVSEGYRRWAAVYDSEANPMLSLERRFLENLLPAIEGRDVVDLGCGTGRWLEALAGRSPRSLTGVDSSPEMLARAEEKLRGRAILQAGRCEAARIGACSADLILCSFLLSYVSDVEELVAQIRRIARLGADIFVTDLHPETEEKFGWRRGFRDGGRHVAVETKRRSIATILAAFERQGMRAVEILELPFGPTEFEILRNAGKSALIDGLRDEPAIYVLHFCAASSSRNCETPTLECVRGLRNGRLTLGPSESVNADITFADGRITSIGSRSAASLSRASELSPADASGFLVLPGLVNAHDHLEFALYPRLGRGGYRNFTEWAQDIHHPDVSPVRQHRAVPKATRLAWGAIRNLLCGVTTVCHHNPYVAEVFENDFPVRVVRDFRWAHSLVMEADVAGKHRNARAEQPFILHLGEGIDAASGGELFELDRMGALSGRTLIVHGLALDEKGHDLLRQRGAALVWCPSSNAFLFGRTHTRKNLRALPCVALGSDSSLTAQGDLLDEMRFAVERVRLSAEELYSQVTTNASRVLRLRNGEGSVRIGALADVVAIRDGNGTPAETLANSTYRDVELVLTGGRVQLASKRFRERLPARATEGLEPLNIDGQARWIRAPLAKLFADARRALGPRLTMNGRVLSYGAA